MRDGLCDAVEQSRALEETLDTGETISWKATYHGIIESHNWDLVSVHI